MTREKLAGGVWVCPRDRTGFSIVTNGRGGVVTEGGGTLHT